MHLLLFHTSLRVALTLDPLPFHDTRAWVQPCNALGCGTDELAQTALLMRVLEVLICAIRRVSAVDQKRKPSPGHDVPLATASQPTHAHQGLMPNCMRQGNNGVGPEILNHVRMLRHAECVLCTFYEGLTHRLDAHLTSAQNFLERIFA